MASSRLQAVETGRWVVQAAPTGFSAFVDPDGAVFERTAVSEQAVIVHEVAVRTGTTWAVQLGAAPWWVLVAVVLTLSIVMPRRTRRRS